MPALSCIETATTTSSNTATPNIIFIVNNVQNSASGYAIFAGQVVSQSRDSNSITVLLYKPVEPLLEKAGAPPALHEEELLARRLAVARSTKFVRISRQNIICSCRISDCPVAVRTEYALGHFPVLFNVGMFQSDGRLSWNNNSCATHSSSSLIFDVHKSAVTA